MIDFFKVSITYNCRLNKPHICGVYSFKDAFDKKTINNFNLVIPSIIVGYYFDLEPRLLIGLSLLLMIIFIAAPPFRLGLSLGLEYFFRKKIK